MTEKEFLQRLKTDADTLTPPSSLSPEAIEEMLKKENPPMKKKTTFYRTAARFGSLAAIFVLGITVVWQSNQISSLKQEHDSSTPPVFTAIETEQNAKENTAASRTISGKAAASSKDSGSEMDAASDKDSASEISAASDINADSGKRSVSEKNAAADPFTYASSYEEIYNTLKEKLGTSLYARDGVEAAAGIQMYSVESVEDSASVSAVETASVDDLSFSGTNLQEAGVDEGDIVKTDGTYLYVLKQDLTCSILKADKDQITLCAEIAPDASSLSNPSIHALYLDGDVLSLILTGTQSALNEEDSVYYTSSSRISMLYTYDISDRTSPKLLGSVTQDGRYASSRKTGQYLYLFTQYTPAISENYADSTMVPKINGKDIPASSFYIPEHLMDRTYLVISSIDLEHPDSILDQKVLVSGANHFYVSTEHIYIASENYDTDELTTEIVKFRYQDGSISGVAVGSVRGWLNNSFSLNEYNGYLRVVSTYCSSATDWSDHNALTILDASMQEVALLDDLAPNETIRSARFLGDTCYFVTFRETDPLFCVDLTIPEQPQVLSELKVTGFSSYLHFYGEDLLLGLGYEADENTGEITGVKLSMFDLSDPANLHETDRTVLSGITWAPAIEDYKAVLVDPEKNLIGFYCDDRYMLYSYEKESGFNRELIYDFMEDDLNGIAQSDTMRGLYIEDTLYLIGDGFAAAFDLTDGCKKQSVLRF